MIPGSASVRSVVEGRMAQLPAFILCPPPLRAAAVPFRAAITQRSGTGRTFSTVGFVGLGNMGAPMARNLASAGHDLLVFDVHDEASTALVADFGSVTASDSAGDVARGADVIVTMLPATQHVEAVYLGDDGLLASARAGTLFIDSSTISPHGAQTVTIAAVEAGMEMVDAPVSGGVKKAALGTLTFMIGGDQGSFARCAGVICRCVPVH